MKLLVADDEDMIRNGIVKYVQLHTDRFEQIYSASNGQEAIDIIYEKRPEILCLDVQMPKKTGLDVMEETNRANILPYTIILSGYDDFEYCRKAMRLGAKDYLLKPVRSSDILTMLLNAADKIEAGVDRTTLEKTTIADRAIHYMQEHYNEDITLSGVADHIGVSAGYLSTLMTKSFGKGFIDCLNEIRIERACDYILQGNLKTYEIAYRVGYNNEKYFYRVFSKIKGTTPAKYKREADE